VHYRTLNIEKGTNTQFIPSLCITKQLNTTGTSVSWNHFDKSIYALIQRKQIRIFHAEKEALVAAIDVKATPFASTSWKSVSFLSSRTILVTTVSREFAVYFLGMPTDLCCCTVGELQPECIVLASDGSTAVFVKNMEPLAPNRSTLFTLIAKSEPMKNKFIIYIPPKPEVCIQRVVTFGCGPVNSVGVKVYTFWGSIFGSNMDDSKSLQVAKPASMPIEFSGAPMGIDDLLGADKRKLPSFTCVTSLDRTRLALGQCFVYLLSRR
jgi:hypothetical protein